MKTKTDTAEHVGMHRFEVAGLGKAPFSFVGMNENFIRHPDGSTQAGGSCDFCGTGIRYECLIRSSDGKMHKVGCDCISKVGDEGLLKAYKTSPEFRKHQADLRQAKAKRVRDEVAQLVAAKANELRAQPHPRGFTDRKTGQPLTMLDSIQWLMDHCGAAGMAHLVKTLRNV